MVEAVAKEELQVAYSKLHLATCDQPSGLLITF